MYVNDIINENGIISSDIIYNKLKNKRNWISEYNSIKNMFPKKWIKLLKTEESRTTKVKTELNIKINNKTLSETTNKFIYQYLMKKKFTKPYIHKFWSEIE